MFLDFWLGRVHGYSIKYTWTHTWSSIFIQKIQTIKLGHCKWIGHFKPSFALFLCRRISIAFFFLRTVSLFLSLCVKSTKIAPILHRAHYHCVYNCAAFESDNNAWIEIIGYCCCCCWCACVWLCLCVFAASTCLNAFAWIENAHTFIIFPPQLEVLTFLSIFLPFFTLLVYQFYISAFSIFFNINQ